MKKTSLGRKPLLEYEEVIDLEQQRSEHRARANVEGIPVRLGQVPVGLKRLEARKWIHEQGLEKILHQLPREEKIYAIGSRSIHGQRCSVGPEPDFFFDCEVYDINETKIYTMEDPTRAQRTEKAVRVLGVATGVSAAAYGTVWFLNEPGWDSGYTALGGLGITTTSLLWPRFYEWGASVWENSKGFTTALAAYVGPQKRKK